MAYVSNIILNLITSLTLLSLVIECTGAIADMEDKEGETALHKAAMNGHLPVIQYLIVSAGADLHAQDADGWTPLHNACSKGYLDIVRFLCNRDAAQDSVSPLSSRAVDQKSKGGWTPLSK
jgi:ankyrin repeat protein